MAAWLRTAIWISSSLCSIALAQAAATPGLSVMAGSIAGPGNIDGPRGIARLGSPTSIAVDAAGNVFITETSSFTVRKIDPSGNVTTIAGKAGEPGNVDGVGAAARFDSPDGITLDPSGNIFVMDQFAMKVREITPDGIVTTINERAPIPNLSGDLPAIRLLTSRKYGGGPVKDVAGNAFEMPMFSGAIYRTTPGGARAIFVGQDKGFGTKDGIGGAATFSQMVALAADKNGTLYVADTLNSLVRKVTPDGKVTTIAGSAFDRRDADLPQSLNGPQAVAVDPSGNAYVLVFSDQYGNAIRKISAQGEVTTLLKHAPLKSERVKYGFEGRQRVEDRNIAVDQQGNVYVSYNLAAVVTKTSPEGKTVTFAGADGKAGFANGKGESARFSRPLGIATDSRGNIYVIDAGNCLLRKITPAGDVSTLAGKAGQCASVDGTREKARLNTPVNLAIDSNDNLYFTEQDVKPENDGTPTIAIRKVSKDGVVTTVKAALDTKQIGYYPFGAEGERPVSAIAVDAKGNVFLADSVNATVRKLSPSGDVQIVAGQPGVLGVAPGPLPGSLYGANGLAIDNAGVLYVTSADAVVKIVLPNF